MSKMYLTSLVFKKSITGCFKKKAFTCCISVGLLLLALFSGSNTNAQILAWNFSTYNSPTGSLGSEVSIPATTVDANVNNSTLTRGTGTYPNGIRLSASGLSFSDSGHQASSAATAISLGEYTQFTLNPKVGFTASLGVFNYRLRHSSTGPTVFIWRYSVDGTNFFDIGTNTTYPSASTPTNGTAYSFDLSGISALQGILSGTTVTFRLYTWGASAAGGTFGVGKSATTAVGDNGITINGTTSAGSPALVVTPATRTGFNYVVGSGPSGIQSFTLSGTNLTGFPGDIVVTAPTNYELSINNFATAGVASLNVAYATATLGSTTIYIRLKAGLPVATYDSEIINCSGGGAPDKTVNCDGSVSALVSSLSDVIVVGGEAATISSTVNTAAPLTSATGVQVWSFTIRDGGGVSDADALATIVNSMVFAQVGNTVSDWSQAIKTAALFDGASNVGNAVITTTQIQFTGLNINVPDNTSKTLTVRLSLNCGIGASNSDGEHFGFSLSNANFTTAASPSSSQKASFSAVISDNTKNVIDVTATQLIFSQQPSATISVNSNFSPVVTVTAKDARGNVDKSFAGNINITSGGTMISSPQTSAATSGTASFSGISFTAAGGPFTLFATSSGINPVFSNSFTVASSTLLNPGDLMIVGYDNYITDGTDMISLATFVPILPNTPFTLANMVYDWKAPLNTRQDRWYDGNNTNIYPGLGTFNTLPPSVTLTYTGGTNIDQGSIICITINNAAGVVTAITVDGADYFSSFTATTANGSNGKVVGTGVSLSTSDKDAIFLMQGTFSPTTTPFYLTDADGDRYRTFAGTVFGGLQTNADFQPFTVNGWNGGPRVSRIHPSIECVAISTGLSANNRAHGYYNLGSPHNDTHRNLIANIASAANWTRVTGAGSTTGDDLAGNNTCNVANKFTVTLNVSPGTWKGTTSTDWFNCSNWDDFTVPTLTTDVLITNAATFNAVIDNNSTKAAQFLYAANAKSVNILGKQMVISNTGSANRNTLNLAGNLTINTASGLIMNDGNALTADGRINIGGNWINNFASGFDPGQSLINFNGAAAQTLTSSAGETFYDLTNSNISTGISMVNGAADVTVSNILSLSNGILSIGTNTLTLNGTVTGSGTLTGSNTSNLLIGGTAGGALGTLNFTAGGQSLGNLTMNRTGAGGTATLGTTLAVNTLATITSGTFDAGTNTLNGTGGLTMTGGELQLGKTGATVPELNGTYTLTAGVVNFKGAASQTIRAINYYDLTSTAAGARVMASSGTVGVANTFTKGANAYTFTGSTVDYNGAVAQNIAAFVAGVSPGSTYNNLTLSNTGTKSLAANTDVEGDLALNSTITFALGNNFLNLKSTATKTARVAPVSESANITYGTGNFVVERYYQAKRAWRLVTAPVTVDATKSLFNSWQVGGNTSLSNSGTYITGPLENSFNGLDVSPQHNYSVKTFNQATSSYDGVGNTKVGTHLISGIAGTVGVPDNISYFIFVRGDRTAANTAPFDPYTIGNATTLRDTGKIQNQSYTFDCNTSVGTNRYTLIGNPFASPVDFANVGRNNVLKKFYAWDPNLTGVNGVGGYVIVDMTAGLSITVPTGGTTNQTQIIQSSQAVLVETTTGDPGSPTVTFNETSKSASYVGGLFRPVLGPLSSLAVNLYTVNSDGNNVMADGVLAQFRRDFSDGVDGLDGLKFGNINETFSIMSSQTAYMLQRRTPVHKNDTIFLNLRKSRQLKYRFNFILGNMVETRLAAYLEDSYLNTRTPVNMEGNTWVDFEVTGTAASAAADRFRIVFKKAVRFGGIKAHIVNRDVAVDWDVEEEDGMRNYVVERSLDGIAFTSLGTVNVKAGNDGANDYNWLDKEPVPGVYFYRIRSVSNNGAVDYSEMVTLKVAKTKSQLYVYPNPVGGGIIGLQMNLMPAGNYIASLLNASGQSVLNKNIVHTTDSATETIEYPSSLTAGAYKLEVTGPDKKRSVISILIGSK